MNTPEDVKDWVRPKRDEFKHGPLMNQMTAKSSRYARLLSETLRNADDELHHNFGEMSSKGKAKLKLGMAELWHQKRRMTPREKEAADAIIQSEIDAGLWEHR